MQRINIGRFGFTGILSLKLIFPDGTFEDFGVVSDKLVTDAYAAYYIDQLQGLVSGIKDFKYHDSGTGTTAEVVGDTGLGTPTGIARVVGSQIEGSTVKTYRTVGIITYDATYNITEWGLFNGASGNTLMDRAVFTAVPVVNNYQIECTYDHIALAGG